MRYGATPVQFEWRPWDASDSKKLRLPKADACEWASPETLLADGVPVGAIHFVKVGDGYRAAYHNGETRQSDREFFTPRPRHSFVKLNGGNWVAEVYWVRNACEVEAHSRLVCSGH